MPQWSACLGRLQHCTVKAGAILAPYQHARHPAPQVEAASAMASCMLSKADLRIVVCSWIYIGPLLTFTALYHALFHQDVWAWLALAGLFGETVMPMQTYWPSFVDLAVWKLWRRCVCTCVDALALL